MELYAYCLAGNHAGPPADTVDGKPQLPSGWRYVKVMKTNEGTYAYNPASTVSILACPKHHIDGEPNSN